MELAKIENISTDQKDVGLYHDGSDFHVLKRKQLRKVQKQNMDALLRSMNKEQLKSFQKVGYIKVDKLSDGHYTLLSNIRTKGGGPFTGQIAYWTTKATGWAAYGALVWATQGEALFHITEATTAIESAAVTAEIIGTLSPTP
jgi:hypothetical protein